MNTCKFAKGNRIRLLNKEFSNFGKEGVIHDFGTKVGKNYRYPIVLDGENHLWYEYENNIEMI